jgi:LPXTG-motif cell wall-anchored protein
VTRGSLAATGGNSWPLVAGGGFLLAALGLVRLRRRATTSEVPTTG